MKILYATDGSEGGLSPGRFFADLPHREDVHIHIVTVLDPDNRGDAPAILASAEAALNGFPGQVTCITEQGRSTSEIADALLRTADYIGANLVTVGASGQSAVGRFLMGSVAETVARHALCPVLVTRPSASPLRDIIVGVDGSKCARDAAAFAAYRLPHPLVCTLRLVDAVPPPVVDVGTLLYPDTPDYSAIEWASREARNQSRHNLEALAETLRNANGGCRVEAEPVAVSNPAAELIRIAEERHAGLIVVGSQGMTGIEHFLLGSVSERVTRHAPCSVLVVRHDSAQTKLSK